MKTSNQKENTEVQATMVPNCQLKQWYYSTNILWVRQSKDVVADE